MAKAIHIEILSFVCSHSLEELEDKLRDLLQDEGYNNFVIESDYTGNTIRPKEEE